MVTTCVLKETKRDCHTNPKSLTKPTRNFIKATQEFFIELILFVSDEHSKVLKISLLLLLLLTFQFGV